MPYKIDPDGYWSGHVWVKVRSSTHEPEVLTKRPTVVHRGKTVHVKPGVRYNGYRYYHVWLERAPFRGPFWDEGRSAIKHTKKLKACLQEKKEEIEKLKQTPPLPQVYVVTEHDVKLPPIKNVQLSTDQHLVSDSKFHGPYDVHNALESDALENSWKETAQRWHQKARNLKKTLEEEKLKGRRAQAELLAMEDEERKELALLRTENKKLREQLLEKDVFSDLDAKSFQEKLSTHGAEYGKVQVRDFHQLTADAVLGKSSQYEYDIEVVDARKLGDGGLDKLCSERCVEILASTVVRDKNLLILATRKRK